MRADLVSFCPACGKKYEGHPACAQCGWSPGDDYAVGGSAKPVPFSTLSVAVIGLFTILPIVYCVFFIAMMGMFIVRPGSMDQLFPIVTTAHLGVMFLSVLLIGFYAYCLFKHDTVNQDKKASWAVAIFMAGAITMPIFWYYYLWPRPGDRAASSPGRGPPPTFRIRTYFDTPRLRFQNPTSVKASMTAFTSP